MSIGFKFSQKELEKYIDAIDFLKVEINAGNLNVYPLSIPKPPDHINKEASEALINVLEEFNKELADKFKLEHLLNLFVGNVATPEIKIEIEHKIEMMLKKMKDDIDMDFDLYDILKGKLGFKEYYHEYLAFEDWKL